MTLPLNSGFQEVRFCRTQSMRAPLRAYTEECVNAPPR